MPATEQSLQQLAVQVGTGDHRAFRCLYTACAPTALAAVRGHLPDPAQAMHAVRATFCEVWWMCAFDVQHCAKTLDVPTWITAIAHRRSSERHYALHLIGELTSPGQAAFWTGLLEDHDQWTRSELAAMLDGPDNITLAVPSAHP